MSHRPEAERIKVRKRRAVVVVGAMILVLAVASVAAVVVLQRLTGDSADYSGAGTDSVVIEVESGDSSSAIATALFEADVVASEGAFVAAALNEPRALGIQPGFYQLRRQMSGTQALKLLLDPASRVETTIAVPEGLRLNQTVDRLVEDSGLPREDFEEVLENPEKLRLPDYAGGNPEGYLFPATYTFDPDVTAREILRTMVQRFDTAAKNLDLVERATEQGLEPAEVVIIASLVQAEVAERDFGKASRVVANRLAVGMPLQFDSTVNYALDSSDLTLVDTQLEVDHPYNTYQNVGLPPGPINSPGEAALEAAVAPPPGDWVYFVAVKPGSDASRFTASYEEFLQFKDQFYDEVP